MQSAPASSTLMASSMTSGPIPSPGTTAIFFAALHSRRRRHRHRHRSSSRRTRVSGSAPAAKTPQTQKELRTKQRRSTVRCVAQVRKLSWIAHAAAAAEKARCCWLAAASPVRRRLILMLRLLPASIIYRIYSTLQPTRQLPGAATRGSHRRTAAPPPTAHPPHRPPVWLTMQGCPPVGLAFCCEVMHELDWVSIYGIPANSGTNLIDCRKTCDSELSLKAILTDSESLKLC
jgi:hypothetical protein